MEKSLFEQIGGTYTQVGDYLLPNLILAQTTSSTNRNMGASDTQAI